MWQKMQQGTQQTMQQITQQGTQQKQYPKKWFISLFILLSFMSKTSFAHHQPNTPINWDVLMEYDIANDAFKPKDFDIYPHGFFSVGCERTRSIIIRAPYNDDTAVVKEYKKKVKEAKVSKDVLAYFLLCDAIIDIRHPPKKAILKFQKMKKAYKVIYDLSVELSFGGEANPVLYLDKAAILAAALSRIENKFTSHQRMKWLEKYFVSMSLTSIPVSTLTSIMKTQDK